jgi:hypothetical protein
LCLPDYLGVPAGTPYYLRLPFVKRHAIFVDAGYLFAQGSVSILGKNSKRIELRLNEAEIIGQLKSLALSRNASAEILRVYWYDGARNGPTTEHLTIANMQDVKLRLGSINNVGQQKEVDSLLVTDLIDLARNQSICDATVVAGDSDVRYRSRRALVFVFTSLGWSRVVSRNQHHSDKKQIPCMKSAKRT